MDLANTMDIVEQLIADELKIPVNEVKSLLNVSEDVKRLADAKIALNRLMRANGIISKMYAAVKSQIARKDASEKAIKKVILDKFHQYRNQIKEGRFDKSRKDILIATYQANLKANEQEKVKAVLTEPTFTTNSMEELSSRDIINMSVTGLAKHAEELAYMQEKEDQDKLESRHIAISKIADGIQREIFCMREIVSVLIAEDRLLNMSNKLRREDVPTETKDGDGGF
jgi:hypothetical protein